MTKKDKNEQWIKWKDDGLFALKMELEMVSRQLAQLYDKTPGIGLEDPNAEADETIRSLRGRQNELAEEFRSRSKDIEKARPQYDPYSRGVRRITSQPFSEPQAYYTLEGWRQYHYGKIAEKKCLEGMTGYVLSPFIVIGELNICDSGSYGVDDSLYLDHGHYMVSMGTSSEFCVYGDWVGWWIPAPVCDSIVTCEIRVQVFSDLTLGGYGWARHEVMFAHTDKDGEFPDEAVSYRSLFSWVILDCPYPSPGMNESRVEIFELEFPVKKNVRSRVAMVNENVLQLYYGYVHTYAQWYIGGWYEGPYLHYTIRPA